MAAAAALAAANARIERNMRRGLLRPTIVAQRIARDERAARRTRKREGIPEPEEPRAPAEEVPVEDVRRAMGGRRRTRRRRRSRSTRDLGSRKTRRRV